jgi:hypothetical protein
MIEGLHSNCSNIYIIWVSGRYLGLSINEGEVKIAIAPCYINEVRP